MMLRNTLALEQSPMFPIERQYQTATGRTVSVRLDNHAGFVAHVFADGEPFATMQFESSVGKCKAWQLSKAAARKLASLLGHSKRLRTNRKARAKEGGEA